MAAYASSRQKSRAGVAAERWQCPMALMSALRDSFFEADVITYGSAITACSEIADSISRISSCMFLQLLD